MATLPDPIPDICESLIELEWNCPTRAGAQFLTFGPMAVAPDADREYRLGFLVEIPIYQNSPIIIRAAIERRGNVIIFDYKEAKYKIEYNGKPAPVVARSIVNLGNQVLMTFGEQLTERIKQAATIQASLEECLVVNTKCHNFYYKPLRIDDVLNAHRLVSPADRWPMYRRQANTPHTKLALVDALSEYAAMVQDPSTRFELSADAGDMLIDRGDLEARPAWHYWE